MSERVNIFDKPQCELPRGGICTACCYFMEVIALGKSRNTLCKFQTTDGCAVHNTPEQPDECKQFHCSDVSNHMKWGLISVAQLLSSITSQEAQTAKEMWVIS